MTLTGTFTCDDGCTYHMRQLGHVVHWVGLSSDGGKTFASVGYGKVSWDGCRIDVTWATVPLCASHRDGRAQRGRMTLNWVDSMSFAKQSECGEFPGTTWRRSPEPETIPVDRLSAFRKAEHVCEMSGIWNCDAGGTYYVWQVGQEVFWLGLYDRGQGWCQCGYGHMDPGVTNLLLEWSDVQAGPSKRHGQTNLAVDLRSNRITTTGSTDFPASMLTTYLEECPRLSVVIVDPYIKQFNQLRSKLSKIGIRVRLFSTDQEAYGYLERESACYNGHEDASCSGWRGPVCIVTNMKRADPAAGLKLLTSLRAKHNGKLPCEVIVYSESCAQVDYVKWQECFIAGASAVKANEIENLIERLVVAPLRAFPPIRRSPGPIVVTIGGPPKAGKTILSQIMQEHLGAVVVRQNDFLDTASVRWKLSGDTYHPAATEHDLFMEKVCEVVEQGIVNGHDYVVVEGHLVYHLATMCKASNLKLWLDIAKSDCYYRVNPTGDGDERHFNNQLWPTFEEYQKSVKTNEDLVIINSRVSPAEVAKNAMEEVEKVAKVLGKTFPPFKTTAGW